MFATRVTWRCERTPVELVDGEEARIRQIAASNIAPHLTFDVRIVQGEDDPTQGCYLVIVPPSGLRPHAVRKDRDLRYPRRDGTTTRWLSEPEVADLYRDRFSIAAGQIGRLGDRSPRRVECPRWCPAACPATPGLGLGRAARVVGGAGAHPARPDPQGSTMRAMRAKLRPLRYWGPLVLAIVCLAVSYSVPPIVSYVLVIASFVLLFEVGTALFERAGGTGGLKDFKQ